MKTAVSLPDRLYEQAERPARRTRKSRSQLYAEAMSESLARHAPDRVTEAMNRVVAQLDDTRRDLRMRHAGRQVLASTEW